MLDFELADGCLDELEGLPRLACELYEHDLAVVADNRSDRAGRPAVDRLAEHYSTGGNCGTYLCNGGTGFVPVLRKADSTVSPLIRPDSLTRFRRRTRVPLPAGAERGYESLNGVVCISSTRCTAVGEEAIRGPGVRRDCGRRAGSRGSGCWVAVPKRPAGACGPGKMYPSCKRALRQRGWLARLGAIESALDDIPLRARQRGRASGGAGSFGSPAPLRGRALRATVGVAVAWLLAACLFAAQARAIYGPAAGGFGADIVSVNNASDEQGNAATTDAAISGNGRYVVFQTRATNFFEDDGGVVGPHGIEPDAEPAGTLRQGGIFRYDRDTGQIQLVADGNEFHTEGPEKGELIFRGAQNPSVSTDGRYVAFSTAQQLVPQDTNENVNVYVRDMDVPLTTDRKSSGAYALVSAKSGGAEPATYAPRSSSLKGDEPGTEVWPNTAMSADGRYVVFRTTELASDLPDLGAVQTPREQLFVRDMQAQTTTLLSRDIGTGEPAGGAIGPATISADGSTVAWVSMNAPEQTVFLPGEDPSKSTAYYLWRRWQESGAETRRVTGAADPEDPECPPEGSVEAANHIATGPCYGPLTYPEGQLAPIVGAAPGLSENGYTVAFLAAAALRPKVIKASGLDAFVTSMAPGVTRKSGTRELTLGVPSGAQGSTQSIESIALSPDGSTVAFTTPRDSFVLPEPRPIGSYRPFPTGSDLYVIHLREDTLERAVLDYEGGNVEGSISVNPALTRDGSTVVFTSSTPDFVFGDANAVSDAFTATLQAPVGTAAPPAEVNATQGGFSLAETLSPELGLQVRRARGGGLILLVETPGPGKLTAQARGVIPAMVSRPKKPSKVRGKTKPVLLAHDAGTARSEGTSTLTLHLSARFARDLKRTGKLKALVTVAFVPPAPAEALSAEANATFVSLSAKRAVVGSPTTGKAKKG